MYIIYPFFCRICLLFRLGLKTNAYPSDTIVIRLAKYNYESLQYIALCLYRSAEQVSDIQHVTTDRHSIN